MSNTVNQTEFINYISEFKKIFVTKVNSPVTQLFKLDSNISDQYYFQILNKNNQIVDLTGRTFQIYGSIVDAKDITHILFYTPSGTIEENNVLHFHINTYNQQYLAQIKTTKQANVTIVETTGGNTQVILRDVGLFYKRPYVDNQIPAEVYTVRILTGSLPWENEFGAGQNINLIEGTPNYAFGSNLSTASNQFVIGDTNTPDGTKAFIVANSGNVFTVDYEGNVEANAISATSLTVNGSQVATAADLTGLATENYVDAAVSGKANLDDVYTKQNVYTYLETDQKILEATSGKADKSELTAYALQSDLALSTANLSYQIATLNIPTKTSDLTNDSGYITGYTAGSGISISNQNVISIDGELGKTYYADDTTLQLSNSNVFSVKSIRTKLAAGSGVMLSEDTSTGVTTINLFGGGSGGGAVQYFEGTGIKINDYYISVDAEWLSQQIEEATQDLQNLSAGTGLKIEDNVISLTAEIPSTEGLASEEWVEQNFLSSIPANYVTSAQLTGALNAYAKTTDLDNYVTNDTLTGYVTTEQLAEEGFATTSDLDTASTTIVNSLTGYVETSDLEAVSGELVNAIGANQTAINEVSGVVDTKTTSAQVTEIITSYVGENLSAVSQLVNDTGFITLASIPDTIEYTAGTNISISDQNVISMTATIPSIEGLASEQYVDGAIDDLSAVISTNYLTGVDLSDYVQTSALEDYAQLSDIPANVSDLTNDVGYITVDDLSGLNVSDFTNDVGYITEDDLEGYTTSAQVSAIASAYAAEATPSVDTICGMLSSANENLTISKQDNKILFTATGGGGGSINLSGGSGIKITQVGDTTVISIATAVITAPASAEFNFDFREQNQSGTVLYTSYNGTSTPTVTISGDLPSGVTTTPVASGIEFIATSGADVSNTSATVNVVFDGTEIFSPVIVPVEIKTVGYVNATISTQVTTAFVFSANDASTVSAFAWDVTSGTLENFSVELSGNLPVGVTSSIVGNSIQFTGSADSYAANSTATLNVVLNADNIVPVTVPITVQVKDVMIIDSNTPLTFKSIEGQSDIRYYFLNYDNYSVNCMYSKNDGPWESYTKKTYITLDEGDTVAFSGSTGLNYTKFFESSKGKLKVYGNPHSILGGNNVTLNMMFKGNTHIVDASQLLLDPVINDEFQYMFQGCTSLTAVPVLTAATLTQGCYEGLFYGCSGLSTVPANMLQSTTLAKSCYSVMFQYCSNLTNAPIIPDVATVSSCYSLMFSDCTSLTGATINTTNANLTSDCFVGLFKRCYAMNYLQVAFSTWGTNNTEYTNDAYDNAWLKDVVTNGTFRCPAALSDVRGGANIPNNWTKVDLT